MRPPGVKDHWDDLDAWTRAKMLAYNNVRGYEEAEERIELYKMLGARVR